MVRHQAAPCCPSTVRQHHLIGTLDWRTPRRLLADPAGALDRITHAAGEALGLSAVFASKVDSRGHLVTSSYGLSTPIAMLVAYTFRKQMIAAACPLVESDARRNALLMRCPAVRDGTIRACVVIPLGNTESGVFGTLLAVDRKPREWTVPQLDFLEQLSILIVSVVELRAAVTGSLKKESKLCTHLTLDQRAPCKAPRRSRASKIQTEGSRT